MTKRPTPSPDDVLRRMLNTPPAPHVAKKPKPKKAKKADK
jgi:hypothetical protein